MLKRASSRKSKKKTLFLSKHPSILQIIFRSEPTLHDRRNDAKNPADKVGVARQTIIAIEQAKYAPSLELAFHIAHVFGVPLHDVFVYDAPED